MKKLSTRLTAVAAGVALTAFIGVAQGQPGTSSSGTTTDSGASDNPWNRSNILTPGPPTDRDQQTISRDAAREDRAVQSRDPTQRDRGVTNRGMSPSEEDRDTSLRERPATGAAGVDRDLDRPMRAARADRN